MKKLFFLMVLFFALISISNSYAELYETEPNNEKSAADAITVGEPITSQLSSKTDQDWFYICTTGADVINVDFFGINTSSPYPWYVSIEDSAGNLLSKISHYGLYDENTSNLFAAVDRAGIYYIKIIGYNPPPYDNYTLTVSISNPGECSNQSAVGSTYNIDGIWQMAGQNYFLSIHVRNSTLIAVSYFPGAGESFLIGTINGNTGHITYASDLSQFNASFTFTSDTTAVMTINQCIPGDYCLFPAGTTINAKKIF